MSDTSQRVLGRLRRRSTLALRQRLIFILDRARRPWQRSEVLLVTGGASPNKIEEIEKRLHFLFDHMGAVLTVKQSRSFPLADFLRYRGVVAADDGAIPVFIMRRLRLNWIVSLDYEKNPFDAWHLVDLGVAMADGLDPETIASSYRTFNKRVEKVKSLGSRPVYLFGTGPSLGRAITRSFVDGTTVVCNTIVRDRELWAHLKPDFFAASDAIYHFGHTEHARQFRADALQRLRESNGRTLFVYPAQFDIIVRREFREVSEVLIPIPWVDHNDSTVDLTNKFALPPSGANVLNMALLPIGCTLSKDVRLWGFDGRSPTDSGFWSNSPTQSYQELMPELRKAHPAFFESIIPAGREDQYVKRAHGQSLDDCLSAAEARGFRFWMLHPSWTPTFQNRFHEHLPALD